MTAPWGGRRAQQVRALIAATLPRPCSKCGQQVYPWQRWDVDHIHDRMHHPELTWDIRFCAPAHARCNRSAGAAMGNRERGKARPVWTMAGW